ncbi:flavin reductase family protein [Arthrobacter sp. SLBN-53]|uniref:flavin reductase family protein n=1 Tax=Arthrobacter sp. SLBN-53 TaxID=2768412 RepID=UPI0011532D7B|nr:flavin reductase family protein [Arthrobacter sp. SLBN-53]TQK28638.1 flavin reductase (DIM6/NTAB) family NADH-FMN oxidoreductase RutF [Arthrobacter sp. SLBN-53]
MNNLEPVRTGDLALDISRLRRLYGRYPTGVAALCALREGEPVGIVATSFVPVSMDPALVSVCVQHTSTTWPVLSSGNHLGVSVLSSKHQAASRQLSAKNADRFGGLSWFSTDSQAIFLHDAAAWFDCSFSTAIAAGDHDVVILQVNSAGINESSTPLVFHDSRYHSLIGTDAS